MNEKLFSSSLKQLVIFGVVVFGVSALIGGFGVSEFGLPNSVLGCLAIPVVFFAIPIASYGLVESSTANAESHERIIKVVGLWVLILYPVSVVGYFVGGACRAIFGFG
ncbi:MAG: hypothetical protein U0638_13780 [Phycisphaerales bacterium]